MVFSRGGGGRGLLEPGLWSRCVGRGLIAGTGEASRNMASGVSRPERSALPPRASCLRDPPVMKVPKLVLRL